MDRKTLALRVAGAVFALVACAHVARLAVGFPIAVGRFPVPLWANVIGVVVAGGLAAWMFAASRR